MDDPLCVSHRHSGGYAGKIPRGRSAFSGLRSCVAGWIVKIGAWGMEEMQVPVRLGRSGSLDEDGGPMNVFAGTRVVLRYRRGNRELF